MKLFNKLSIFYNLIFTPLCANPSQNPQKDLVSAIFNANFENSKLAMAMGANANLENSETKNTIIFDALEQLKIAYAAKQKKTIYTAICTCTATPSILCGLVLTEKIINKEIYITTGAILYSVLSIMAVCAIFSGTKAYKIANRYSNLLNISRLILTTTGTIIDEKIENEFANSKQIPAEISSMIKSVIAAQKTAQKLI